MLNDQCNTCGGFENLTQCSFCPTTICSGCKVHHEPACEPLSRSRARGEGPTIANSGMPEHRAGHVAPPFVPADRPLIRIPSAAPVEPEWADKIGETTDDGIQTWVNAGPVAPVEPEPSPVVAPETAFETELLGIENLFSE
jgi:hypothetical protein